MVMPPSSTFDVVIIRVQLSLYISTIYGYLRRRLAKDLLRSQSGQLRRHSVDMGAQFPRQWVEVGVLPGITEIECVIKIRWIAPLRVLEHGFQLVEGFGEARFGCGGGVVLIPQGEQVTLLVGGQRRQQFQEMTTLLDGLVHRRVLIDGGDVAVQRLAQVVDHTQLEQAMVIDAGVGVLKEHHHQAEAPRMLGGAFWAPLRRKAAAQRALELLRRPQEGKKLCELIVHKNHR